MSVTNYYASVFICATESYNGKQYDRPFNPDRVINIKKLFYETDDASKGIDTTETCTVYKMNDMTEYSIQIINHSPVRARARVFIDGKRVIHAKIEAFSTITLRRPVDTERCFTFVKASPTENPEINPFLGLITVYVDRETPQHKHFPDPADDTVVECVDIVQPIGPTPVMTIGDRPRGNTGGTVFGRECKTQKFIKTEGSFYSYFSETKLNILLEPTGQEQI